MILIGIDVLILLVFGAALVFASYVTALVVPLGADEGRAAIISTAITAAAMVVAYILMASVLDMVFGALGW